MAKFETPVGILITVALLALFGLYGLWLGYVGHLLIPALLGAVALVAAVGAAMLKRWSRYLVYLLTAGVIGTWSYSLYASVKVGYFEMYSASQLIEQLGPGAFLIALSCFCAYAVFRHFRSPRPKPDTK